MNHKQFCAVALATAFAVGAIGLGTASAADVTKWQGYTYQPKTGVPQYDFLPRITNNVDKATNGKLKISVVPGGTLPIKGNDVANAVADNIIQFAGATSGTVSLVPIYGMTRLPMLFPDEASLRKGLDQVLQPAIDEELDRKDVKDLCMWWYPAHSIWSVKKKITSLDDLKGMKLRVTSPQQGAFVKKFGAIPVTIATAEVAPALQQGVVDGALTSAAGALLWVEYFDYNYKLLLNFGTSFVLANKQAFAKLTKDEQQKLMAASKEGCNWVTTTLASQEAGYFKKYQGEKMVDVVEAKPGDKKRALEAAKQIWEAEANKVGPKGVAALAKLKKMMGDK